MKNQLLFKAALLLLGLLIGSRSAGAYDFMLDGIYYKFNLDRYTVSVVDDGNRYTSFPHVEYRGDIVIPQTLTYQGENYTVTAIGDNAFSSCDSLTSISFPSTIKTIGKNAFWGCNN